VRPSAKEAGVTHIIYTSFQEEMKPSIAIMDSGTIAYSN
jgi:hypothetical protein